MLINAFIAFLAAFGMFCLIQGIKRAVYRPLPKSDNIRISAVVAVSGYAPELEQSVRALRWLFANAGAEAEIVLRDCGMDADTALAAQKLSAKDGIKLII